MSRQIDERVVEMRFDNKQFESATKETLSTLEKLKAALKLPNISDVFSGMEKAAKKNPMESIAASVESLEKRFSTLGIVGMRVIENLTDGFMNKLSSAVQYATDKIVNGGIKRAMNIENAHFQLQALLKDEEKVQAVMANAMESVDGTAYAYDEAAKAASQFAASGVKAGDDMLNALKGITGVAAMTNSDFESIARIFTTVAGNGRIMGDQLLQLSSRGLNVASTLADYFREVGGEANIAEADIREMVTKGMISFDTFAKAMYWAFGESAARANETFTGSLANMGSALARIGAGFVSPLIEQNSELVKMFNALRIQINNIKSALVFDEQKSALSGLTKEANLMVDTVSSFVKDGTTGFDQFTTAILETSKSEKELEKANESLAESYDKVRENGSASVGTLIEFNEQGINATAAIKDYMNGVLDGTIKVSEETKNSIREITGGMKLMAGDVTKYAKEGAISYDIFTDAIVHASGAINKESKMVGDTVSNMMKKVKDQGAVTVDTLVEFNQNGMNAAIALRKYMDGVTDGSIRASYATTQAVMAITEGNKLAAGSILELAEQGVIGYDIFQSAMENMYGDQRALSKQFTEYFLDNVKQLTQFIESIDFTKPMEAFYYTVESGKNVFKGLLQVLEPVGKAFYDVFMNINGDNIVNLTASIERLTANLKLSEKASSNLYDAFKGIFDVGKLLIDIIFKLLKLFIPLSSPIEDVGDSVSDLAGAFGRSLTSFTEWARSSETLKNIYEALGRVVQKFSDKVKSGLKIIRYFVLYVKELPVVQKALSTVGNAIEGFLSGIIPFFSSLGDKLSNFKSKLTNLIPDSVLNMFHSFRREISKLGKEFSSIEIGNIGDALGAAIEKLKGFGSAATEGFTKAIDKIKTNFKSLFDFLMQNEGIYMFVTNIQWFFKDLQEAFSQETLFAKIEKTMEVLGKFIDWFKDYFSPIFEGFTIGGAIGTGGGIAIIYAIIEAVKAFNKVSDIGLSIPKTLGEISKTLSTYQKDLKADALLKLAKAIGVFAVSLTLLSFADTSNLAFAAITLAGVSWVLIKAFGQFEQAIMKGRKLEDSLYQLSKGLKKAMNNLSKSVKYLAIGKAFKSFAESIAIIALSIAGLGFLWQEHSKEILDGALIVGEIAATVVLIVLGMSIIGQTLESGMTAFAKASFGILAAAAAIYLVVAAIGKIMKMEFSNNIGEISAKLFTFILAVAGVASLIIAIGEASKIADKNTIKSAPIMAAAASIYIIMKAIEKLMALELPTNPWDLAYKTALFGTAIGAMVGLLLALGKASDLAGNDGLGKATKSLIALAADIVILVGALYLVSFLDTGKAIGAAVALAIGLVGVGAALWGAGKISEKTNWKSIMAMGVVIGAIAVFLAALTVIPTEKLWNVAGVLGISLLSLAAALYGAGQIWSNSAMPAILGMVAAIAAIGVALYVLSDQDWPGLLGAAGSLGIVLVALSAAFLIISKSGHVSIEQAIKFVATSIALFPIAGALSMIAGYEWSSLIAAAVALGGAAAALALVFAMIGEVYVPWENVLQFVVASLAIVPIGYGLSLLAANDWGSILAATIPMIASIAGLVAALEIMSIAPISWTAIAAFAAGSVSLLVIAYAVKILAEIPFDKAAAGLVVLAGALVIIGLAAVVMGPISPALLLLSAALLVFGVAIGAVGVGLYVFIERLLASLNLLGEFMQSIGDADFAEVGKNIVLGLINGIVGGLSALWEIVEGIGKGILNKICDVLDIHSPAGETEILGLYTDAGYADGVIEGEYMIDDAMESVYGSITDSFDMEPYYNLGNEASSSIGSGLKDGGMDIGSIMSGIMDQIGGGVDMNGFSSLGGLSIGSFGSGWTDGSGSIVKMMTSMMSGDGVEPDLSFFTSTGDKSADSWMSGFSGDGSTGIATLIKDVMSGEGLSLDYSAYGEYGAEGGSSFLEGFNNMFSGEEMDATASSVTEQLSAALGNAGESQDFTEAGRTTMRSYLDGFKSASPEIITVVEEVSSLMRTEFANKEPFFKEKGGESINAWIAGARKKFDDVSQMTRDMVKRIIDAIKNKNSEFRTAGSDSVDKFIIGIKNKNQEAYASGIELTSKTVSALMSKLREWIKAGTDSGQSFAKGITDQNPVAVEVGKALSNAALSGLSSMIGAFYESGANAGQGFVNGLNSKTSAVSSAAEALGKVAESATKKALDEHSPSKKAEKIGEFFDLGLAKGIAQNVGSVEGAGTKVANSAIETLQTAIDAIKSFVTSEDIDSDLTLTPVVDLSNVRESTKDISAMFNEAINAQSIEISGLSGTFTASQQAQNEEAIAKINSMKDLVNELKNKETPVSMQNTFNIQGDNPDEIAEKVSGILQRQIERNNKKWG